MELTAFYRGIPYSLLYGLGFSLILMVILVSHCYDNLQKSKKVFFKPVFDKLGFEGYIDHQGSVVKELKTYLFGKLNQYYYRINVIEHVTQKYTVQIIPFVQIKDHKELAMDLQQKYGLSEDWIFNNYMSLSKDDLVNEYFLYNQLLESDRILIKLGVKPQSF